MADLLDCVLGDVFRLFVAATAFGCHVEDDCRRGGGLAVYSGDDRTQTQNREQAELFSAVIMPAGETHPPKFVPDTPPAAATVPTVHPNEAQDVARMRGYRVDVGGKQLKLLRGEFHRHTEYSAHRDGDGLLEDSLRYALDTGALDWMGNGDHDNGLHHEFMWWQIQRSDRKLHGRCGIVMERH